MTKAATEDASSAAGIVPATAPTSTANSGQAGNALATAHRVHGGADALGAARFDFSTNSNACGPCPTALAAVQQADASRYPDSAYGALRKALAAFHSVEPERLLLAGSASECIFRITAWVARRQGHIAIPAVCVPPHAYGDYTHAAQAWGLELTQDCEQANLVWCCEPSSPLGGAHTGWPLALLEPAADSPTQSPPAGSMPVAPAQVVVLDCAYAPLRLSGQPSLGASQLDHVWQMYSPNKSLGLTGVRAAYAIAPSGAEAAVQALDALAPSWPLGAHGVAMLLAWAQPEAQTWLAECQPTLRRWKARQLDVLGKLGWACLPSDANFFCARPAPALADGNAGPSEFATMLQRLRATGIKLRDATSFGLPGHMRLSVQPPVAQDALRRALQGMPH